MPSTSVSTVVGWTLAILLYVSLLSAGVYQLQHNSQRAQKFTAQKKNLLNVTLVERKETKEKVPKKRKVVKEKKSVDKPKPVSKPKNTRAKTEETKSVKPDLKKLFDTAKLEKLPEDKPAKKQKTRKKIVTKDVQEVLKKDDAKKLAESLDFDQQEQLIISQRDGVYDEFRGEVSDILDSYWQQTIDTVAGNSAWVLISIDKFGNFSYKIETLSYNDAFNAKLRDFLSMMEEVDFPPFEGGDKFLMKTEFKDDYGE